MTLSPCHASVLYSISRHSVWRDVSSPQCSATGSPTPRARSKTGAKSRQCLAVVTPPIANECNRRRALGKGLYICRLSLGDSHCATCTLATSKTDLSLTCSLLLSSVVCPRRKERVTPTLLHKSNSQWCCGVSITCVYR